MSRCPSTSDLPSFCLVLQRAARIWRRGANEALNAYNLSEATTTPLWVISRLGDGLRQRTLAEHLGIEGQSLVRLLDQLEATGLLSRKNDKTDRRAKTIHLTKAGRSMVTKVNKVIDQNRARMLEGVSQNELEIALRVLNSIIASGETSVHETQERLSMP